MRFLPFPGEHRRSLHAIQGMLLCRAEYGACRQAKAGVVFNMAAACPMSEHRQGQNMRPGSAPSRDGGCLSIEKVFDETREGVDVTTIQTGNLVICIEILSMKAQCDRKGACRSNAGKGDDATVACESLRIFVQDRINVPGFAATSA